MWSRRPSTVLFVAALTLVSAGCVSAMRVEQTLSPDIGDMAAARTIEVTDWAGEVLLRGTWSDQPESPANDAAAVKFARRAELASPTNGPSSGFAEIEIDRRTGLSEERLDITIENLPYPASCKLTLDGRHAVMFSSSPDGKLLLRLTRRVAAAVANGR